MNLGVLLKKVIIEQNLDYYHCEEFSFKFFEIQMLAFYRYVNKQCMDMLSKFHHI